MNIPKRISSLFSFFLILNIVCCAQDTSKVSAKSSRHFQKRQLSPLPTLPVFPGGQDSLAAFIKKHTRYPKQARIHHISGIIEVDFMVTVNGTIKNPTVLKPLGYGCDEEALRIVHLMPKWIPAKKGRQPIELKYHVNIPFEKTNN